MAEQLLTPAQMAHADALAIESGTPGWELMKRAGAAVAGAVRHVSPSAQRFLVLCGPGNNGGDGYVAAKLLADSGHPVIVARLGPEPSGTGDAARAAATWAGPVAAVEDVDPADTDVIVDALFGAGLTRDLSGEARRCIEAVNASGRPVLAVDLPSGIDGATGAVRGAAVKAAMTVTFAARKLGHLLMPGRSHCGPVTVTDIGISEAILRRVAPNTFANGPGLWSAFLPRPSLDSHKYKRGHTLAVAGGATRTGAARLAAMGALRIGSGLVTLACPPEALGVAAAHLTAVMLRGCDGPEGLAAILRDARFNAVVLGPALGVNAATRAMIAAAISSTRGVVLDADAISSLEGHTEALAGAFRNTRTVLTPHDGEFSRIMAGRTDILADESKVERARRAAAYLGATIVYKGSDTVIAHPDGRAAVNENGSPYLATAGSGDVLGGLIAGMLAQRLPAFEAASAAVWIHAAAGAAFGPGLIAEDLPSLVPTVLKDLGL
jgi:hydroxyethylthiazole kinase-like uncharacterized protein yjeF